MAPLSQTLTRLTAAALLFASGLRSEAAAYQIDEPRIGVAEGSSSGGDFQMLGGLREGEPETLSNAGFQLTGTFSTFIYNHAPFAATDTFTRPPNDDLKIELRQLLANDFDPDSDVLSIQVSNLSAAGAPIEMVGSWIFYRHISEGIDSFAYTARDTYGASSQGRVDILIGDPNGQFSTHLGIATDGAGVHIKFNGIPNRIYLIQSRDTLDESWIDRAPANDLGLGRFQFDDAVGAVTHFYRVLYRP